MTQKKRKDRVHQVAEHHHVGWEVQGGVLSYDVVVLEAVGQHSLQL